MVEIETGDSALRITSLNDDLFVIDIDGWQTGDVTAKPDLHETIPVDETVSGRLRRFRVSASTVSLSSPDLSLEEHVGETAVWTSAGYTIFESVSLPRATYRVTLQRDSLTLYAQFEEAVDIIRRSNETWVVALDQPSQMSFAVRDASDHPRGAVTAEPTPEGIARALSTLSAGLRTTTPDRSFPSLRVHPPRIKIGDSTTIPASVREQVPETHIELSVPASIGALLSVAPLAHYLCATVIVADCSQPVIRAPPVGVERRLPPPPELSTTVSDILERTFWLDCLVRNAGPHGVDLADVDQARDAGLELDLDTLYDASPAERLRRYFEVDFETAAGVFPRWQTAAVVEPTTESVRAVPRLAFALARVYLPAGSTVSDESVGTGATPPTEPPSMGPDEARVGCRVVSGAPSDPLSTTPSALHRFTRDSDGGPLRIVVADNTDGRVDNILTDRPELTDSGVQVESQQTPTGTELQMSLADPPTLLYYAADNATSGIECADGTVSVTDLPSRVADIVILDVPDSVSDATRLVGSDRAAAVVACCGNRGEDRIDTDLIRWLLRRARVGDALWLSRRYGATGSAVTAVGDVFRQLRTPANRFPSYYWCNPGEANDGGFMHLSRQGGHQILSRKHDDNRIALTGTALGDTLSSRTLREGIMDPASPVIYDGRVYWREEGKQLLNPLV